MPIPQTDDEKGIVLKELGTLEIKDAELGLVEAVIATLNVVDRDMDVILPDAIAPGSKVKMSCYGHDIMYGDMPVGKGTLNIDGDKAVFKGKLFLDTQRGRETFGVLKEMGKDQEWSFGFQVIGSEVPDDAWKKRGAQRILTKLDAFEVSPVLRGAGIGTRTVATKEEKPAEPTAEEIATKAAEDQATIDQKAKDDAAKVEEERAESERNASEVKERTRIAVEEFHRVQRTFKRLHLI